MTIGTWCFVCCLHEGAQCPGTPSPALNLSPNSPSILAQMYWGEGGDSPGSSGASNPDVPGTLCNAETTEPKSCTYPAATWHGKKGHSSLRNSLHAWRHSLLTEREATERVFPAPLLGPGMLLCHPILDSLSADCEGRSHPFPIQLTQHLGLSLSPGRRSAPEPCQMLAVHACAGCTVLVALWQWA